MQPQFGGASPLQLTVIDWKHSFDVRLDSDTDLTLLRLLLSFVSRLMTDCSVTSVKTPITCFTHYYLQLQRVMNTTLSDRGLTTTNYLPELLL